MAQTQENFNSFPSLSAPAQHANNFESILTGAIDGVTSFSNAVVVGAPLAGAHVAEVLWNSALEIGNWVTPGESFNEYKFDLEDTLNKYNKSLGQYYGENKEVIDFVGDVGSLFIPGTAAVKILQAAKTAPTSMKYFRMLGWADRKRDEFLGRAVTAAANRDLVAGLTKAKLQAYATAGLSAGSESLLMTGLSFVSLNESQLFDDYSISKFVSDTAFGGVFIGAFRGIATNKRIRDAVKSADAEYFQKNFIPGAAAGTPTWEKAYGMLQDAERVSDPEVRKQAVGKVREFILTDLIPKQDAAIINNLDPYLQNLTSNTFLNQFGYVNKISKYDKKLEFDLDDFDGAASFLEERKVISSLGSYKEKATFFGVVPKNMNAKRSHFASKEIFLTQAEAEAELAARGADKFKIVSHEAKKSNIYIPNKNIEGAKPFYAINSTQVAKSRIAALTAQEYAKKVSTGAADAPLSYYHLDTYSGRVVSNIIPTAGDLGIEFKRGGMLFGEKEFANLDEYFKMPVPGPKGLTEPTVFDAKPHFVDGYLVQNFERLGKKLEGAPRWFGTTKSQREAFGKDAPSFAFASNDYIQLQTAFASGLDNIPILNGGKIEMWNKKKVADNLRDLKIDLFNRGVSEHKLSLEELSVRLNINAEKFARGDYSEFAVYSDVKNWEKYASPRHVTVRLDTGEMPNRTQLLANFDRQVSAAAKQETNKAILAKSYREILPLENLPDEIAAQEANRAPEVAGLLTYGGYAPFLGITAQVERIGAVVNESTQKTLEAINKILTPAMSGFLKDESRLALAELNFVQNIYRKNPANLSLQLLPGGNGTGKILNKETGKFIKEANSENDLIVSPSVAQYIVTQRAANARIVEMHNAKVEIYGKGTKLDPNVDYFAPQDVRKKPYFALVRMQDGQKAGISAGSADALTEKINIVKNKFPGVEVFTKEDIRREKKLLDEFDADDFFANAEFNTALRREGVMADLVPDTGAELFENQLAHYGKAVRKLIRNGVVALYQKDFEALQFASAKYSSAEKSIFGPDIALQAKLGNPFDDLIKTSLNISSIHEYELLNRANHTLDYAMTNAKDVFDKIIDGLRGNKNEKIQEGLNELAKKHGVSFDYEKPLEAIGMFDKVPRNVANDVVTKANGLLASLSLKWDALYPIVNLLTGPMLYVPAMRNAMRNLRMAAATGNEGAASLVSVGIPGTNVQMPSVLKLLHNTTKKLFDEGYQKVLKQYVDDNLIGLDTLEYTQHLQDTLRVIGGKERTGFSKAFYDNFKKVSEFVGKWTITAPNNLLKLYSADAAYQIGQAAGMSQKEIKTLAQQLVVRTNGNYVPSQRPVIFQGPIGHAVGLFQTFTFGVMQNLFKYTEEGDVGALAAFMGLQTLTFGAQSNPIFKAINGHIGARDSQHKDLYTQAYNLGEIGDFILYGAPSDFLNISLYTRGDLTPRNPSVIPTNLESIPVVSAGLKVWRGMASLYNNISAQQGLSKADPKYVLHALSEAMMVSSLNRPLAGILTLAAGRSMTGTGDTITNQVDSLSAWTRVLGGRPFDEAKTLDFYYRNLAYNAQDHEKIKKLGTAIKSKIASGADIDPEDINGFAERYVASGGNAKNFRKYWMQQLGKANSDLSQRLYKDMADEPKFEEARQILSYTEVPD